MPKSKKLRFLIIGGYNTLFGYLAFAGLYLWLGNAIHYLVILVLAHFLSVTNAFVGHRFLVFRSTNYWLHDFLRFNLSYLGALGLGLVLLPVFVSALGINPLIAQAMNIAVVVVLTYTVHENFTFKQADNAGSH